MSISLKEQLKQAGQLTELIYHAPQFNTDYYNLGHNTAHESGRVNGRQMFYDFYAMEFLWSFLGSGQIPKAEREKRRTMSPEDPESDIMRQNHRFLPANAVKTIDNIYDQVTNAVAKSLISYIRMAVVQEFRYLLTASGPWTSFRNDLVSLYNKNKTVTKEEYNALVAEYIPEMAPYPDSVKRLLKFAKYYNESFGPSAFDAARKVLPKASKKSKEEPSPEAPIAADEPIPASAPDPEDTTDYNAEPVHRNFGQYGGPGQPTYDPDTKWSGNAAFNDIGDLPKIPDDDEDEQQPLTEAYINPDVVRKVYDAINKSGVTLDDIEKAYNKISWGGSAFGGEKWGAGAVALLKLIAAKKNMNIEDMNHVIDHIYDLQHNTGSLLNKGPMYVSEIDLNRRYKITDVARFIPFVSPIIKELILRYQKYLRHHPGEAELEAKMEDLLKSPKLPLSQEEITALLPMGFKPNGDNSFRVGVKFKNKKDQNVGGVFYQIAKHKKIDGEKPLYIVSDNLQADVKAFPTFEEAMSYLKGYQQDMYDTDLGYGHTPIVQSAKDIYLNSHTRMKLPPNFEQLLLDLNIGYRPNHTYYKAYFNDGKRFALYAFTDGTFLTAFVNSTDFKTFTSFDAAYVYASTQVKNAQEYPNKATAQQQIDIALGKSPAPAVPAAPAIKQDWEKQYTLSGNEKDQIEQFVKSLNNTPENSMIVQYSSDGMAVISKKHFHTFKPQYAIGHEADNINGSVKVVHLTSHTEKSFSHWHEAFAYLKNAVENAMTFNKTSPAAQVTTPTKNLPPPAASQASYKIHAGLATLPKDAIRLTKEDEAKLEAIGFNPVMISSSVWYKHKGTGDTVKFYPNDTAKVIFTQGKGSSSPMANFKGIQKCLDWLPTKYQATTNKSPVATGATVIPPTTPTSAPIPSTVGVHAGIVFNQQLMDVGFQWNEATQEYLNGWDKLKIAPNRSSVMTFGAGGSQYFKDLPALVAFLKNGYLQKKSSAVTPPVDNAKLTKLENLLDKGGFKTVMFNKEKSKAQYDNAKGNQPSNQYDVITYNLKTTAAQVFDHETQQYIDMANIDELIKFLEVKYGEVSPAFTSEQREWLNTYMAANDPNLEVTDLGEEELSVHTKNPIQALFHLYKHTLPPLFTISIPVKFPLLGSQYKTEEYNTFEEVAAAIEKHIATYKQWKNEANKTQTLTPVNTHITGVPAVDRALKKYGFKYNGPSHTKSGFVFEKYDFDGNVIDIFVYYTDGSAVLNTLGTDGKGVINMKNTKEILNALETEFFAESPPESPATPKSSIATGELMMAPTKDLHEFIMQYGFMFSHVFKTYSKGVGEGEQTIDFDKSGIFNYQYNSKDGSKVTVAGSWNDPTEVAFLGKAIEDANTVPNSLILAPDGLHDLLKAYGFHMSEDYIYSKGMQTLKFRKGGLFDYEYPAIGGDGVFTGNWSSSGKIGKLKMLIAKLNKPVVESETDKELKTLGFIKHDKTSMPSWFGTKVLAVYYNADKRDVIQVVDTGRADLYHRPLGKANYKEVTKTVSLENMLDYLKNQSGTTPVQEISYKDLMKIMLQ